MIARIISWIGSPRRRRLKVLVIMAILGLALGLLIAAVTLSSMLLDGRGDAFRVWALGDEDARKRLIVTQQAPCPGAPFILPAAGFIGLLYGSSGGPYTPLNPHQGIDIFSPDRNTPGLVPVYAAYDGYITREDEWRSSLIQRIPEDPLEPNRQIWLYYTHMADRDGNDFIIDALPPGTIERFVEQGTLLGYTGNYNGTSPRGIWVHLHFSIVMDDGRGRFLNELEFDNTIDPTPYLGMPVNQACAVPVPACGPVAECI